MNLAREAEPARVHLMDLSVFLNNELRKNGFDAAGSDSQIVPILLGSNDAAVCFAKSLAASGFGVRAIRPPTVPAGTARLRLSVTAKLSREILAGLVAAMIQTRDKLSFARMASVSR
jgi:8-amino-7-oxononanoate synthase